MTCFNCSTSTSCLIKCCQRQSSNYRHIKAQDNTPGSPWPQGIIPYLADNLLIPDVVPQSLAPRLSFPRSSCENFQSTGQPPCLPQRIRPRIRGPKPASSQSQIRLESRPNEPASARIGPRLKGFGESALASRCRQYFLFFQSANRNFSETN